MNIIVTGAAGFIGSALVKRLLVDGHNVIAIDNLSTGLRSAIPAQCNAIIGDIGDPEVVKSLPVKKIDAICHLAGQSSGAVSMEQPYYDFQANAASTLLLSQFALRHSIPRFLYASSMAVYGDPKVLPVTESTALEPISYYGVSKLASEGILKVAARQGLNATALRMFNVYGPGQNLSNLRQGMASIYLAYMLKGVQIPVTGSLDRFRDFIYIDDVIDVWMRFISIEKPRFSAYNVGSGIKTTVAELLDMLKASCGLPSTYPIEVKKAPVGDQFGMLADISRLYDELGWKPATPLESGLQRFCDWAQRKVREEGSAL